MELGRRVEIIPLNKRMKDRIHQHGSSMVINRTDAVIDGIKYDVELKSLGKTFQSAPGLWSEWTGWIILGKDCSLKEDL